MTKMAMEGVKIIDCTWLGVGAWLTRYLADHGAAVIHVETATHPEMLRRTPPFKDNIPGVERAAYMAKFNHNKYGITLNLVLAFIYDLLFYFMIVSVAAFFSVFIHFH